MTILNLAGYRFIELDDLGSLQKYLLSICQQLSIKGTILLSKEGINLSLAGSKACMLSFKTSLAQDHRFANLPFHETWSHTIPFQKLKVKIKKEIITFKQETTNNIRTRANSIAPTVLKQWLDEQKDITLLDTRNQYEIAFGSFKNAINPEIAHFTELPAKIDSLDQNKPVVMFCTGGVRCEKAAHYMQSVGFNEVYQLDGGILGYFREVGNAHWVGSCFVFDERIALDPTLTTIQQTPLVTG